MEVLQGLAGPLHDAVLRIGGELRLHACAAEDEFGEIPELR